MTVGEPNAHQTVVYSTRAYSLRLLPVLLGGVLLCLAMFWATPGKTSFAGIVGLVVFVPMTLWVLAGFVLPPRPMLTLSPAGLVNHRLTKALVRWQDIERVDITDHEVTHRGVTSTLKDVIAVWTPEQVYDRTIHVRNVLMRGPYWDNHFRRWDGKVAMVLIPAAVGATAEELHAEIETRRRAFRDRPPAAVPAAAGVAAAIRRGGRAPAAGIPGLRHGAAPVWAAPLSILFALGIAVVLANMAGLWETDPQRTRRVAREAWMAEDNLRREEDRKRRERFDAMFRDMDRTFARPPARPAGPTYAKGHRAPVLALAVAPDGRRFLGLDMSGALKLWDMAKAIVERDIAAPDGVVDIAILPDGETALIARARGEIAFVSLRTGSETHALDARDHGELTGLALTPDGRRAVTSHRAPPSLVVWDIGKRERIAVVAGEGPLFGVAVTRDGTRAAGLGGDGRFRVFDLGSGAMRDLAIGGPRHGSRRLVFTAAGGRAVTLDADRKLRLWSLEGGAELRVFDGPDGAEALALSPDGARIAAAADDGAAFVWDVETGRVVARLDGYTSPATAVAVAPDGSVLAGALDGSIRLWPKDGGTVLRVFPGAPE